MMNCQSVPLIEFFQGQLDEEETGRVLAHLDECEDCRERLQVLAILQSRQEASFVEPEAPRTRWRFWPLAAALLLAAGLSILWMVVQPRPGPEKDRLANLATSKAFPYFPLQTRSGKADRTPSPARRQAFTSYATGDFDSATRLFSGLKKDPEILFYLGVTQYMRGEFPAALELLKRASEGSEQWRMPADWYRANAYLKLGRAREAKQMLQAVSGTTNEFQPAARELLDRLNRSATRR